MVANPPPVLKPITAGELLRMELPPREAILAPWLPTKGLAMVYAPRGVGKTHLSLAVAYAVAAGAPFLKWRAPKPRQVLFIDGEMPAGVLQTRLARIADQCDGEPPDEGFIRFLAADLHENGLPDLATAEGQEALRPHLGDAELIVLDNLSTLCRAGKENEADSWSPVQDLALALRREGRSVLFVHHAGKSGAQRGTSRREDVLDTVINLKRPDDYSAVQGARFIVTFEKARGFMGKDADSFEAALDPVTGAWTTRDLEDVREGRIAELTQDGLSQAEIARELGVNRSTVSRQMKRLKDEGRLQ
ncbi:MAG: AAA family ATPase [Caulobacteraceae bacterium]